MKFTADRSELLVTLKKLKPGVATRDEKKKAA
jgi:hypothetical protein